MTDEPLPVAVHLQLLADVHQQRSRDLGGALLQAQEDLMLVLGMHHALKGLAEHVAIDVDPVTFKSFQSIQRLVSHVGDDPS